MSSSMPFPLQLKRQFARPIDPDSVFDSINDLNAYLNSGVRYAGMIAYCNETPGRLYMLNAAKDSWIIIPSFTFGEKSSEFDAGNLFDISLTDDYLYICVLTGGVGDAKWKKISLSIT